MYISATVNILFKHIHCYICSTNIPIHVYMCGFNITISLEIVYAFKRINFIERLDQKIKWFSEMIKIQHMR